MRHIYFQRHIEKEIYGQKKWFSDATQKQNLGKIFDLFERYRTKFMAFYTTLYDEANILIAKKIENLDFLTSATRQNFKIRLDGYSLGQFDKK